jgi:hypothetical protein
MTGNSFLCFFKVVFRGFLREVFSVTLRGLEYCCGRRVAWILGDALRGVFEWVGW